MRQARRVPPLQSPGPQAPVGCLGVPGSGGGGRPVPGSLRGHSRLGAQVTGSRGETVWGLVAVHAAGQGRRVSVADVCAVAVSCAQVTGAWVTAASGRGPDFVMYVTDPVSEQLAELQLTLGEGPCHDIAAAAAPVLAGDLGDDRAGRRWPAFTAGAGQLGAEAVFAFPLTVGVIRAGTMGLFRSSPGPLARPQLGDILLLADTATVLLLDGAGDDGDGAADGAGLGGQAPDLAAHRAEVDQATGMLTLQLGVTVAEAFARLRAYAYAQDRRLADVAGDIVARRLRLHPDPDPDPGGRA
jgi:ANTAR domain